MDSKIINAFCRVDWARLRQSNRDKITAIGAKYNCKPLLPGKYTQQDNYIIKSTDEYKHLIATLYKEIAKFEPHLHALFDYYKDTDKEKAQAARWANKICKQYHDINQTEATPPQVSTLPDWAQSTEGAQILDKLAEAGYCSHVGQLYHWNKSKALWGVFADEISDAMKLRESNDNVPYVLIAEAFVDIDEEFIKSATQAISRRKNGWIRQTKQDIKLIDVIYK